ncbi:hypothetical protein HHK36_007363 [Tetracentron sinense]|uniref:Ninja-family protein n=1 Tax=Tetracentron sinense TaxID=13715 RepID=A0A834ZNA9_TETSI|nr:hypothetical protein HHK36_007363 [Tetracentron sinense]
MRDTSSLNLAVATLVWRRHFSESDHRIVTSDRKKCNRSALVFFFLFCLVMGDSKEGGTSEVEQISMQINGFPRDLLQRLTARDHRPSEFEGNTEDSGEIELNLGLSLGGCFGVDPKEKKLIRSSSVAGFMTAPVREGDGVALLPVPCPPIMRTCSLPTETEEERRKRKEIQSLRRMEAKRKRSEKQRNFRAGKDRASLEGNCEEDKRAEEEGLMVAVNLKGKVEGSVGCPGFTGSVASVGSHGSNSSGISEFESRPVRGLSNCTETRSPASVQSLPEQSEQKLQVTLGTTTTEKSGKFAGVEMENPSKKPKVIDSGTRETERNVMEDMPCVSTRGDGPNGRRVEGFLYKYKKGEEVLPFKGLLQSTAGGFANMGEKWKGAIILPQSQTIAYITKETAIDKHHTRNQLSGQFELITLLVLNSLPCIAGPQAWMKGGLVAGIKPESESSEWILIHCLEALDSVDCRKRILAADSKRLG